MCVFVTVFGVHFDAVHRLFAPHEQHVGDTCGSDGMGNINIGDDYACDTGLAAQNWC